MFLIIPLSCLIKGQPLGASVTDQQSITASHLWSLSVVARTFVSKRSLQFSYTCELLVKKPDQNHLKTSTSYLAYALQIVNMRTSGDRRSCLTTPAVELCRLQIVITSRRPSLSADKTPSCLRVRVRVSTTHFKWQAYSCGFCVSKSFGALGFLKFIFGLVRSCSISP